MIFFLIKKIGFFKFKSDFLNLLFELIIFSSKKTNFITK